ncbi:hypothetical protein [Hyphobacterium sp.]|uniref:hypothetical protein n=1 Tax=Hyphobacterium sp. TaxID=2004662 RepID=UPI003B515CFA
MKTKLSAVLAAILLSLVSISGRDFEIPGDLAFDLGLIWHELATNSAKYGALKSLAGDVQLSWNLIREDSERYLSVLWRDTSPVDASTDMGTGFGTRLISQLVETKYHGSIEICDRPEYCCRFRIRLP